nr:hypothetical protein [Burkholderia lata]
MFASVAPLVNTIHSGVTPTRAATAARAPSSASRASRPCRCDADGLPYTSRQYGAIASITSGATGVRALKSR